VNLCRLAELTRSIHHRRSIAMRLLRLPRRRIERLGPYPSLLLVAVPLAVVEPLKVAIVFFAGSGHWITGTIAMMCAYAVSLFVTHRLFRVVRPKLLRLPWFAAFWTWLSAVRRQVSAWVRSLWQPGRRVPQRCRAAQRVRPLS
jgi:hypothetical protein